MFGIPMLGNTSPPKRRCDSSILVGAVQYSLKILGEVGWVSWDFPILMFQIFVPVTQRGLWREAKLLVRSILWEHYMGTCFRETL